MHITFIVMYKIGFLSSKKKFCCDGNSWEFLAVFPDREIARFFPILCLSLSWDSFQKVFLKHDLAKLWKNCPFGAKSLLLYIWMVGMVGWSFLLLGRAKNIALHILGFGTKRKCKTVFFTWSWPQIKIVINSIGVQFISGGADFIALRYFSDPFRSRVQS